MQKQVHDLKGRGLVVHDERKVAGDCWQLGNGTVSGHDCPERLDRGQDWEGDDEDEDEDEEPRKKAGALAAQDDDDDEDDEDDDDDDDADDDDAGAEKATGKG